MIPVAIISRPLNYLWLNVFSNQLLNLILNGNTIPYLFETILRTSLDQTLFAFPFYVMIMTVKNFFSSFIEERPNGTLHFNSLLNTLEKFKESMIQTFIPHYIDLKNFLFTPFTKLLIGDLLVSGIVMGVLFFFFPTTAFLPSSIMNIFVTTFLTYLMHSKDLSESNDVINQAENKIITIKNAEKNAGNEMNREEFRKYFKQKLDKPITRLKLRSLLIQLCLNSSLLAKKAVSDEKYNNAIQTLNDFISNYQTNSYSA